MTLQEIATLVSGWVAPENHGIEIFRPASLSEAGPGDITFFGNPKYLPVLRETQATAVLVPHGCGEQIAPVMIWCDNPADAFARVLARFAPPPPDFPPGIHSSAVIAPDALIDPTAHIAPHVTVETGARIGARTVIGAGSVVERNAVIGDDCRIHSRVTIAERCELGSRVTIHGGTVVGSDGFGYEFRDGRHHKIPQTGIVQIDDEVEIGANCAIDRARFGRTWIQEGTKVDNLVQIAHNVRIGRHTILCSQVGISGSTKVGSYATLAGQVGVVGHLEIGDRAIVAAQSGVNKSVPEGEIVGGGPARPIKEYRENCAQISRLPKLYARVKKLEEGGPAKS